MKTFIQVCRSLKRIDHLSYENVSYLIRFADAFNCAHREDKFAEQLKC